jgi:hypothetical protein
LFLDISTCKSILPVCYMWCKSSIHCVNQTVNFVDACFCIAHCMQWIQLEIGMRLFASRWRSMVLRVWKLSAWMPSNLRKSNAQVSSTSWLILPALVQVNYSINFTSREMKRVYDAHILNLICLRGKRNLYTVILQTCFFFMTNV